MNYAIMHPKEVYLEEQRGTISYRLNGKEAFYKDIPIILRERVPQNVKVIIIPEEMAKYYGRQHI